MTITRNDVNFVRELVAVQTVEWNGLRDVVRQVNWRLTGEWTKPGGQLYRIKTYINTDLDFPGEDFVVYPDLTKEEIMSWINPTAEELTEYENKVLANLNDLFPDLTPVEDRTTWVPRMWI
jgi:hypothetical protein